MSKKYAVIITILAVLSLCLAAASLVLVLDRGNRKPADEPEYFTQYVMYVGTNDKDTYAPKYTHEEAMDIVDRICLKYFEGYTIQEATGSWVDETGVPTHEYTIVCHFDGAEKETVYAAADEIIEALNQNTILIETQKLTIDYYGGNKPE